ncbi:hypothetical protein [Mucilaginibacter ginsenosidivorax]|uniref:Uncharacterized protein n=1 Tax=Mucilaginibacter ginsenosidivorax TaxID=862126 RepID=A0A5B8VW34_9SPHI|nr:hypothetical protein [Mucilaginibacter ginsenosidivorax]QEC74418.1 hypothetical protein FSB76_00055 [Mucilaginibacter ginsenosidivorax]
MCNANLFYRFYGTHINNGFQILTLVALPVAHMPVCCAMDAIYKRFVAFICIAGQIFIDER